MKERLRRILSMFMAFCIVLTTGMPVSADEVFGADTTENIKEETDIAAYADGEGDFIEDGTYAILSKSTNKSVNITELGWQHPAKVEAAYYVDGDKVAGSGAQFKITKVEGSTTVYIELENANGTFPLVKEQGGGIPTRAFINNLNFNTGQSSYNNNCKFILKQKIGSDSIIIQAGSDNRYATVSSDGYLTFEENTDENSAEEFLLIKNPTVLETAFSIEHKESGKYIKTYDTAGEALTVDGEKNDEDTKFSKAVFGTQAGRVTVSLVSKSYNKGIKSGGGDIVVVNNTTLQFLGSIITAKNLLF